MDGWAKMKISREAEMGKKIEKCSSISHIRCNIWEKKNPPKNIKDLERSFCYIKFLLSQSPAVKTNAKREILFREGCSSEIDCFHWFMG